MLKEVRTEKEEVERLKEQRDMAGDTERLRKFREKEIEEGASSRRRGLAREKGRAGGRQARGKTCVEVI